MIQRQQLLDDLVDRRLMGPQVELVDHGRDLDGDVVDVVTGKQVHRPFESGLCLAVSQHGLTQQIEVEPHP